MKIILKPFCYLNDSFTKYLVKFEDLFKRNIPIYVTEFRVCSLYYQREICDQTKYH